MESKDFPSIYQESDSLAIDTQEKHFRLVRTKIAFLLAVGIVTSVTLNQTESYRVSEGIVLTIFLVLSIALTAILYMTRFDKIWCDSRAIAESIKAETWVFMMKVGPYGGTISDSEAESRFLNRLNETIHLHQSVLSELASYFKESTQITAHMRCVRNQSLESRREFHSKSRIHDQCVWYAQKTRWNKSQESKWFVVTWVLELSAFALALVTVFFKDTIVSPVGIMTTASAGLLSWINARSYTETSLSYGLVAHELSILEDRASHVTTEEEMANTVLETENTIGQEHRIWLARLL